MTVTTDVSSVSRSAAVTQCVSHLSRRAQELAADPADKLRAAGVLLRGAPALAGWVAGWAATEFPVRVLTGHALSTVNLGPVNRVSHNLTAQRADAVLQTALTEAIGDSYSDQVTHPITEPGRRHSVTEVWRATHRSRYAVETRDVPYGPSGRDHLLDIWRRPDITPEHRAPVLIQIPGGAWAISEKRGQAVPLVSRMVELGWICITINYSRSPMATWPRHIIDVKRAIAWVRENIAEYGGDPDFLAITGGSAGAHVGALAALTDDPALQPGFEHVDTRVQAVVPYYGAYDLTDPANMCELMLPFLESFVMPARLADDPALYRAASPIAHVHAEAPPFFVLHGRDDAVIPHTQAQAFVAALRGAGATTVAHAELPNAHHAFDTVATLRSQLVCDAVADFLGVVYGQRSARGTLAHHAV